MSAETITGYSAGVRLTNPATQNPLNVASTGFVYGTTYGISGSEYAWTINNQGLIFGSLRASSVGISLYDGGTVINGGSVVAGSPGNAAEILGYRDGIYTAGPATITNYGAIEETLQGLGSGVFLGRGGSIVNETGASIAGHNGVIAHGGTIVNDGTIEGTNFGTLVSQYSQPGVGIFQWDGGAIINNAVVEGGITTYGASTVFNGGSVASAGSVRLCASVS